MNAVNQPASPQMLKGEGLQRLAHWLKSNGSIHRQGEDARSEMAARYPEGLLSHAELDALVGVLKS